MANKLRVRYLGTNVGKIYFSDIEKRHQLGGADEGQYLGGHDQYIIWGETKVLELTSDVLFSMSDGILKYFSTDASSSGFVNGAPLVLDEGAYTKADESPRQDLGDTGGTRYDDDYMDRLADAKWGTGAAGDTGYFVGNSDDV